MMHRDIWQISIKLQVHCLSTPMFVCSLTGSLPPLFVFLSMCYWQKGSESVLHTGFYWLDFCIASGKDVSERNKVNKNLKKKLVFKLAESQPESFFLVWLDCARRCNMQETNNPLCKCSWSTTSGHAVNDRTLEEKNVEKYKWNRLIMTGRSGWEERSVKCRSRMIAIEQVQLLNGVGKIQIHHCALSK